MTSPYVHLHTPMVVFLYAACRWSDFSKQRGANSLNRYTHTHATTNLLHFIHHHMYIHTYTCAYTHTHVHTHIHMYIHTYTCAYTHTHVHTHIHTTMRTYKTIVQKNVKKNTRPPGWAHSFRTYTHTHAYTHTRIHIYTYVHTNLLLLHAYTYPLLSLLYVYTGNRWSAFSTRPGRSATSSSTQQAHFSFLYTLNPRPGP